MAMQLVVGLLSQGGTGVNLTPPPPQLVSPAALQAAQRRIEAAANALGIQGFARLDAFMHADTGEVVVIEANTVPGMTPSTVLFHQVQCPSLTIHPASAASPLSMVHGMLLQKGVCECTKDTR
jgi:hypothetical protein